MRALTVVLMVGVASMLVVGCGPKKEEQIPQMEPAEVQAATTAPTGPVTVESPAIPAAPSASTGKVAKPRNAAMPTATPAAGGQTYTVKAGDTLYTLAKRFYGDGKLWTKIADANKDKIKDVSHVPVGTVLTIPPK